MKLHCAFDSPVSMAVLLFGAESEIPLEIVEVDLMKGEQFSPAFTALNPSHLVPVLDDDGFVLTESAAILRYLAEKFDSPMYPRDLRQRATVNERLDWFNTNFYRAYGYCLIYSQALPHLYPHDASVTEWGRVRSEKLLDVLDTHWIGPKNNYVCGERISIADFLGAEIVNVGSLIRADLSRFNNVSRWLSTMRALPHWESTNAGIRAWATYLADKAMVTLKCA